MGEKTVRTRFKPSKRTFIREWRKHRGHTLEDLAELIGVTPTAISNVETGKSGYTQGMLEHLADALACTPADLLERDPADPADIAGTWAKATPDQKTQIAQLAKIIVFGRAA